PDEADTTAGSPETDRPPAAPDVTDEPPAIPTDGAPGGHPNDAVWKAAWDAAPVTLHEHDFTVPGPAHDPLDENSRPESVPAHSVLEVRRFDYAGHPVIDVTLRIQLTNPEIFAEEQESKFWENVHAAAQRLNKAGLRIHDRDLFHLTVLNAADHSAAHQRYQRTTLTAHNPHTTETGQDSTATTWHVEATPADLLLPLAQLTGIYLNSKMEPHGIRSGSEHIYITPAPRPRTTSQNTPPLHPDDHPNATPQDTENTGVDLTTLSGTDVPISPDVDT
ncbi:hypothetical protein, partial [Streptomyces sp. AC627_RSS907]|uniref:hypothetical protein n=1 Tax=Streptomyces sp. AC627_RSS907 TaxID=2823684 RepID=UPI001C26DEBF